MIGYVTLGTNDLAKAVEFYDALAKELGTPRMMENESFVAWGVPGGGAGLGITKPHDGKPATIGNGVMVALEAKDRAQVDRIHQLAGRPRRRLLRRVFPGPRGEQAERLRHGLTI